MCSGLLWQSLIGSVSFISYKSPNSEIRPEDKVSFHLCGFFSHFPSSCKIGDCVQLNIFHM